MWLLIHLRIICRFVSTILNELVHQCTHKCIIHTHPCNTQTCTFTHNHHAHIHTLHDVHVGWILSSVCCKPRGSWQGCGEAPSGWGYSRPAEQGGKLCSSVNCSVMYSNSLYTKYSTLYSRECKVQRAYPTDNRCCYAWENKLICVQEACTFSGLGTYIGLRMLISNILACYRHVP